MEQAGGLKNCLGWEGRFAIAHVGLRFLWGKVAFVAARDVGAITNRPSAA